MKSKLKIWGSNTISRGAYSSTGNLTSISCSLSVGFMHSNNVWGIYGYGRWFIQAAKDQTLHEEPRSQLFSRLRCICRPVWRERVSTISAYEFKTLFRIHFFAWKFFDFFSSLLLIVTWFRSSGSTIFYILCFFLHSHTNPSEAQSPAVRPNKNANLIK